MLDDANLPLIPIALACSRRGFLARSAGFGLAASLPGAPLLGQALGFAPRQPKLEPKADAVIQIYLGGGLSHIDTFDPKPALAEHEGEQERRQQRHKQSKRERHTVQPLESDTGKEQFLIIPVAGLHGLGIGRELERMDETLPEPLGRVSIERLRALGYAD